MGQDIAYKNWKQCPYYNADAVASKKPLQQETLIKLVKSYAIWKLASPYGILNTMKDNVNTLYLQELRQCFMISRYQMTLQAVIVLFLLPSNSGQSFNKLSHGLNYQPVFHLKSN